MNIQTKIVQLSDYMLKDGDPKNFFNEMYAEYLRDEFYSARLTKKEEKFTQEDFANELVSLGLGKSYITDLNKGLQQEPEDGEEPVAYQPKYQIKFKYYQIIIDHPCYRDDSSIEIFGNGSYLGTLTNYDMKEAAKFFMEFDKKLGEFIVNNESRILIEANSLAKTKAVTNSSVEAILEENFRDSDILWRCTRFSHKIRVAFKIHREYQIEINLSYDNFVEELEKATVTVFAMRDALKRLGGLQIAFRAAGNFKVKKK